MEPTKEPARWERHDIDIIAQPNSSVYDWSIQLDKGCSGWTIGEQEMGYDPIPLTVEVAVTVENPIFSLTFCLKADGRVHSTATMAGMKSQEEIFDPAHRGEVLD